MVEGLDPESSVLAHFVLGIEIAKWLLAVWVLELL
jgi:hypothetical protein